MYAYVAGFHSLGAEIEGNARTLKARTKTKHYTGLTHGTTTIWTKSASLGILVTAATRASLRLLRYGILCERVAEERKDSTT